uniref:(California timema) hypothetical protein n=1 Tax=Timema californicum TaxID=61474 RepID=A0A7R9IYB8_TIMCA|nr:unnamed protein product [Timema californicum]
MSKAHYRRMQLLQEKGIPTQAEVRNQLGSPLAEIFFSSLTEEEKVLMGLSPRLNSPEDPLWVDPSEVLMGNLVKSPPITSRHIQALTHVGIMEIGEQSIVNYEQEMARAKEEAIAEAVKRTKFDGMLECREAIKCSLQEEKAATETIKEQMLAEFTKEIKEVIKTTKQEMEAIMMRQIQKEREEVALFMGDKMMLAVENTAKDVTSTLKAEEAKKMETFHKEFNIYKQMQKHETEQLLKNAEEIYQEKLETVKREKLGEDLSENLCIPMSEKDKFSKEKQILKTEFELKAAQLQTNVQEEKLKILTLEEHSRRKSTEISSWKRKIKVILEEFQKFINYVHNAVEGNADYMLSEEKIFKEELAQMSEPPHAFGIGSEPVAVTTPPETTSVGIGTEMLGVDKMVWTDFSKDFNEYAIHSIQSDFITKPSDEISEAKDLTLVNSSEIEEYFKMSEPKVEIIEEKEEPEETETKTFETVEILEDLREDQTPKKGERMERIRHKMEEKEKKIKDSQVLVPHSLNALVVRDTMMDIVRDDNDDRCIDKIRCEPEKQTSEQDFQSLFCERANKGIHFFNYEYGQETRKYFHTSGDFSSVFEERAKKQILYSGNQKDFLALYEKKAEKGIEGTFKMHKYLEDIDEDFEKNTQARVRNVLHIMREHPSLVHLVVPESGADTRSTVKIDNLSWGKYIF